MLITEAACLGVAEKEVDYAIEEIDRLFNDTEELLTRKISKAQSFFSH